MDGDLEIDGYKAVTRGADPSMVVVTAAAGDEVAGCLVGFHTEASISPPRYLVCLSRANRTYRVAARANILAVHLLARGQRDLAELFGAHTGDDVDKFARCEWERGPGGVPVLAACAAWFAGAIEARVPLGDHTGYHLRPIAGGGAPGRPLRTGEVVHLEPGHPP